MAFAYLAGVTTAGAADEIVDWFATFEAWITAQVGWTVEAGAGTTDLVLRSVSEAGGLTMLYLHVWRDPGNPDRVRIEVRDDLAGTHQTNEAGYLDGGGFQFAFWMAGDMDAINVCFRGGATYHSIYAGLVLPFALTVANETYSMIATSTQIAGSILRDSTGVWDVDHGLHDCQVMDGCPIDPFDGSLALEGTYFDRRANIAGQLKHISGAVTAPTATVGSTIQTGRPGATSTWIILRDRDRRRYAMRTGGVLPAGMTDPGTFVAAVGVAANINALWAAISAHLTGLGWTDLGDPGLWTSGRLYSSPGESGVDQIYIGYAWNVMWGDIYFYVQDDAGGTHRFPTAAIRLAGFPINYWLCGDMDCCVLVLSKPPNHILFWSGLVPAFAPGLLPPYPGLPLTTYQLYAACQYGAMILGGQLRRHDGTWNVDAFFSDDGTDADFSNPNNFDGTTYLVWPLIAYPTAGGAFGQLRYVGYSSGGGIASMDTITVGAEVYTVFFSPAGTNFCVRTV